MAKTKSHSPEFTILCLILLCIVAELLTTSVVTYGPSMEPTYTTGDVLVYSRGQNIFFPYENGDVLIIQSNERKLVKRLIASAGEEVIVDGVRYDYWKDAFPTCDGKVPEGYLFVCGDNRSNSMDSRNPEFGLVPVEAVCGKVLYRLFRGGNQGG